jgi:inward rectifier potassium channel
MLLKRINKRIKTDSNTGFSSIANSIGGRFFDKDGSANVKKVGVPFFERISWFHALLEMKSWKFLLFVLGFYGFINLVFACLYFWIGVEHLHGISNSSDALSKFGEAFFFSTQTFTTVGYGRISPVGFLASLVASVEALIGLLSFALATGLFFGRFSKPIAHLKFSHNAIIAPYQDGKALMFRIAPYKNTNYIDVEAKITLGVNVEDEDGKMVNKFYILDLEMNKINTLTLSWTIVHPITKDSPLYDFTPTDFANIHGEVLVVIKAFDVMSSNTVAIKSSYTFDEIVYGAKFRRMYTRDSTKKHTLLHLNKLNTFRKVVLDADLNKTT